MVFDDQPRCSVPLELVSVPNKPVVVVDAAGQETSYPRLCLKGYFRFLGHPDAHTSHEFHVDTGAKYTMVPRNVWNRADEHGLISWRYSPDDPNRSGRPSLAFQTGVAGNKTDFHFGVVKVVLGSEGIVTELLAMCSLVDHPKTTLLGLGGKPMHDLGASMSAALSDGGLCLNFARNQGLEIVQI